MPVDLPPEIWVLVAQYLPKESVIRLISVNRVFYTLAMDERYRALVVEKVDANLERTLDVLRNPENAKRVRSVYLDPSALQHAARYEAVHAHHRQPSSIASYTVALLHTVFPSLSLKDAPPSAAKTKDALQAILPLLQNVDSFTFTWDAVASFDPTFLSPTWRSLAANLQHLRLKLHPRSLATQLPQDVSFPSLTSLHFTFCRTLGDDHPDHTRKASATLSKFINKFTSTLQSLYIGSPQRRDISSTYTSLSHFPYLRSFELSPHTFACPSSVLSFLSAHAHSLTSLTYVSDSNPLFSSGLSDLALPHLTKLVMRLHYVPYPRAWWSLPCAFFQSIARTLRVLSLEGAVTLVELDSLLNALGGSGPEAEEVALEELSVGVSSLSAEVLVCIARRVPGLRVLDLRIHDVVATGGFPITPSEFFPYTSSPPHPLQTTPTSFTASLTQSPLPSLDWRLHDLTITRRACCGDLVLWGLMVFVARECVPGIASFARRGTRRVPDPPNERPEDARGRGGGGGGCRAESACAFWAGGPAGMPVDSL